MDVSDRIIIKVQFGEDIRRIPIHNNDINYDELVIMLRRIFKDDRFLVDDFVIKYKDEASKDCASTEESMGIIDPRDRKTVVCELRKLRDFVTSLADKLDSYVISKEEVETKAYIANSSKSDTDRKEFDPLHTSKGEENNVMKQENMAAMATNQSIQGSLRSATPDSHLSLQSKLMNNSINDVEETSSTDKKPDDNVANLPPSLEKTIPHQSSENTPPGDSNILPTSSALMKPVSCAPDSFPPPGVRYGMPSGQRPFAPSMHPTTAAGYPQMTPGHLQPRAMLSGSQHPMPPHGSHSAVSSVGGPPQQNPGNVPLPPMSSMNGPPQQPMLSAAGQPPMPGMGGQMFMQSGGMMPPSANRAPPSHGGVPAPPMQSSGGPPAISSSGGPPPISSGGPSPMPSAGGPPPMSSVGGPPPAIGGGTPPMQNAAGQPPMGAPMHPPASYSDNMMPPRMQQSNSMNQRPMMPPMSHSTGFPPTMSGQHPSQNGQPPQMNMPPIGGNYGGPPPKPGMGYMPGQMSQMGGPPMQQVQNPNQQPGMPPSSTQAGFYGR